MVQWILTVLSTIAGLITVGAVYNYAPAIQSWNPPPMIASLGAAAILEYNAIRSPFAQPRNCIVGHTLSAIVAVGVAKLFMLAPGFYEQYMWIASVVSCAAASLVMSITNTVHPPGGAAAILACVDKQIIELGWMFPALVLLGSAIMMPVAQLFNNTLRQYPVYWWTADETGSMLYRKGKEENDHAEDGENDDLEKGEKSSSTDLSKVNIKDGTESERTLHMNAHTSSEIHKIEILPGLEAIHITPHTINVPSDMDFTNEESEVLQRLMKKLRQHLELNLMARH